MNAFELTSIDIALFLTDKEYTNDDCAVITLEQHIDNVLNHGATPDLHDNFDTLSGAVDAARRVSRFDACVLVNLETGEFLEEFGINPTITA